MNSDKTSPRTDRKIAKNVGILFILATVAGVLSVAFLEPALAAPDYLENFTANGNQIIIGAILDLVGAGAFVALAIVIFPVLKRKNESIAIGYIIARTMEAVPFIVANLCLLALLALSRKYSASATQNAETVLPTWTGLRAIYDFAQLLGPRILASLAAVPFYTLLYQTNLLPRWISVWGLLGAPLYLASGLLSMIGLLDPNSTFAILLFIPAAVLEMVLAGWLIAKGFNPTVLDDLQAM